MSPRRASQFFLHLHDWITARRPFVLATVLILIGLSVIPLANVRLDMSFGPFSSDDPEDRDHTARYEAIFGQRMGNFGGLIIENDSILSDPFLDRLDSLSGRIAGIENVSEVMSLTRYSVPDWTRRGEMTTPFRRIDGRWSYDGLPNYRPSIEARARQMRDSIDCPPTRLQYIEVKYLESIAGDSARFAVSSFQDSVRADPRLEGLLLSHDGRMTLVLARIGLPMSDLDGRSAVMHEIEKAASETMGGSKYRLVGFTHVEEQFADVVMKSLLQTYILTFAVIALLLWLAFSRFALVVTALAGVALSTAGTAGLLTLIGQDLTMINSMVPVVILIIGAADAIHMLQSFQEHLGDTQKDEAIRRMVGDIGWPCFLTSLTTAAGFLGLMVAKIIAIRDFGFNVSIGVALVFLLNLVFIPSLLAALPASRVRSTDRLQRVLGPWGRWSVDVIVNHGRGIAAIAAFMAAVAAVSIPFVNVDQLVNGEVSPETPLRADQQVLEDNFAGFLGPDLAIRRDDGAPLTHPEDVLRLRAMARSLRLLPQIDRVDCYCDLIPLDAGQNEIEATLLKLRQDADFSPRLRGMISDDLSTASMAVLVGDLGTARVDKLIQTVDAFAFRSLGYGYQTEKYGYWWLAQIGMKDMVSDMLSSFATSLLIILPILLLSLGNLRLFLISLAPNLLPMIFALAFAAWLGIPIRIGTAMVLAIAIGIAVDDSIHLMLHLRKMLEDGLAFSSAIAATMRRSGAAVCFTSVVLVAGFLSMQVNDLLAIQDMGLMAASTLTIAFLADIYVAPSLYRLLESSWR